jgi:protein gp37
MQRSPIEWTEFTSNPVYAINTETGARGHFCVKCSPGCLNCYAAKINTSPRKLFANGLQYIEKNRAKVKFILNEQELAAIRKRRKPATIFLGDMTDLFQDDIPDCYLDAIFATMALCPQHTFQVLTKRTARMRDYLNEFHRPETVFHAARALVEQATQSSDTRDPLKYHRFDGFPWPLPNVWIGTSAEDQQRADERLPILKQCPAAVRYVSYEPALGRTDFSWHLHRFHRGDGEWVNQCSVTAPDGLRHCGGYEEHHGIDWIIVGGESGQGQHIRAFDLDWARDVVQQCWDAGVAVFVKQFGSRPMDSKLVCRTPMRFAGKGGDWAEWPDGLRVRQFPKGHRL